MILAPSKEFGDDRKAAAANIDYGPLSVSQGWHN